MKLSEIPGIGDISDMEIRDVQLKLKEQIETVTREAGNLKAIRDLLSTIEGCFYEIDKYISIIRNPDAVGVGNKNPLDSRFKSIKIRNEIGTWSAIDSYEDESGEYVLLKIDSEFARIPNILCGVGEDGISLFFMCRSYSMNAHELLNLFKKEVKNL